jgi:4'-phosphopantetheinyl transferase
MQALSAIQVREYTTNHPQRCEAQHLDAWLLTTRIPPEERSIYETVLSSAEQQAAARFRFEADRERSVVARGGLRWILSAYCGVAPDALKFQVTGHGKPSLLGLPAAPQFNVSHSGDYVLIGVTISAPCGVDIERSNPRVKEKEIARRYFCPREVEWLDRTRQGFLRLWTMKESIIKAVGRGLSIPLSDVDVTDVVEGKTSIMMLKTPDVETQTIWLQELDIVEGYAAAVAMIGNGGRVNLFPFS